MTSRDLSRLLLVSMALSTGCVTTSAKPDAPPVPTTSTGVPAAPVVVDHFAEGLKLLEQGKTQGTTDYAAVLREFQTAAEVDPKSEAAHFNAALAAERLGQDDVATRELRAVLQINPQNAAAVSNLARMEVDSGSVDKGIQLYQDYLKVKPDDLSALNEMSTLYASARRYDESVKVARQVLLSDPLNVQAYKNLSRVYFDQGNYKLSQLLSLNALKLSPNDPGLHNDLGVTLLRLGNEPAAIASFKKSLELDPKNIPANLNLGQIAIKSGDFNLGLVCFEAVLAQIPAHEEAGLGKAVSLRGQQDIKGAIAEYERVLQINPNSAVAVWNLGVVHHKFLQDFDKALQFYDRYATLKAADPGAVAEARAQMELVKKDQAALAEAKRLEEERKREAEELLKKVEEAKAPLVAAIADAEKVVTDATGKAPQDAVDGVKVAIDQAKQVLELGDLDLMGEALQYLKELADGLKGQIK